MLGWILLVAMLALAAGCGDAAGRTQAPEDGETQSDEVEEASVVDSDEALAPESGEVDAPDIASPGFDPEVYVRVADEIAALRRQVSEEAFGAGSGDSGGAASGEAGGTGGSTDSDGGLFSSGTDADKAEAALNLADDMAIAVHMGQVTPEMLTIGGEAVLGYPHPLLLNNYGAMVMYAGDETQAEPFFRLAVLQDSGNPVYLTNLADVLLEEGDDAAAEQFIRQALSIDNEYGPAYQVLTTIHLMRGDDVLAAETMVKGAWHYFDDLSELQFQSFLMAVESLDPAEDEYPLKESYLDILYKIARENVDTMDNGKGTDTPEGQLDLKPFPEISGAENLMNSQEWLNDQLDEMTMKHDSAHERAFEHQDAFEEMDEWREVESGVFVLMKNMRQYYVFQVMMSYYGFKMKQLEAVNQEAAGEIENDMLAELENVTNQYEERMTAAESASDEALNRMWAELMSNALGTEPMPDVSSIEKEALLPYLLEVEKEEAELSIRKKYAGQLIEIDEDFYEGMEQPLEEFWLKTGGLLKYIADEDVFEYLAGTREEFIWDWIWRPIGDLEATAGVLLSVKNNRDNARQLLEQLQDIIAGGGQAEAPASEEKDQEDSQTDLGSLIPELEKESLTVYPEPGDHGEVGVEGDLFGVLQGSASFDGDNIRWEGDTPTTKHTGGVSTLDGSTFSSTLRGISVEGNTKWITKMADMEELKRMGKAGKTLGSLGKISFTKSETQKIGYYTIRDSMGRITDQGIHYVHETGSGVWELGKSEKIEVTKSFVTGVAIRKNSTKYKFEFATYEQ